MIIIFFAGFKMHVLSVFLHFFAHNMVIFVPVIFPGQGYYIILAGFIILFTQGFFLF